MEVRSTAKPDIGCLLNIKHVRAPVKHVKCHKRHNRLYEK